MKFMAEIDIDFLEEDQSMSDAILSELRRSIESQVLGGVRANVTEQVGKKLDQAIQQIISSEVASKVSEVLQTLLTKPRTITDNYGRVQKENVTLEDMLIDRIHEVFTKKTVNSRGEKSNNGDFSEIQWFMESRAPALISEHVKTFSAEAEKRIKSLVEQKIKTEVADKLTNIIVNNSSSLSLKT